MKFGKVLYNLARTEVARIGRKISTVEPHMFAVQAYVRAYRVGYEDGLIDERDAQTRREAARVKRHVHDEKVVTLMPGSRFAKARSFAPGGFTGTLESDTAQRLAATDYSEIEARVLAHYNFDGTYENVVVEPPWFMPSGDHFHFKTETPMPVRMTRNSLNEIVKAFLTPDSQSEGSKRVTYLAEKLQGSSAMTLYEARSSEIVLGAIVSYLMDGGKKPVDFDIEAKPRSEIRSEADLAAPKDPWEVQNITLTNLSAWTESVYKTYGDTVKKSSETMNAKLAALRKAAQEYGHKDHIAEAIMTAVGKDCMQKILLAELGIAASDERPRSEPRR